MEEVADAFTELAAIVNSRRTSMHVKKFSDACSLFSGFFGILETSFRFAQIDYVDKVKDLAKASRSISTLEEMVDRDIAAGRVDKLNSHTGNLLKVKRGLQLIKVFFQEILATEGDSSLKAAARKAYNEVLYPYHEYNVRQDCATAIESLPKRSFVLLMLGETEETVQIHIQSYVTSSARVIAYIDNIFFSKNLAIN